MRYCLQIFILLCLFICSKTSAQSFSVKTDASTIGRNDVVQVEYEVKDGDDISGFVQPVFNDWKIIAGPSTAQTMSYVNGQSTKTFSYVFVLSPLKTGHLQIPGTAINADGKKLNCTAKKITVTNQLNIKTTPAPPQGLQSLFDDQGTDDFFTGYPVLKANEKPEDVMRKNIFVKATASKTTCYVGEPVLVTYKLYTAIQAESRVTKQPSFSGCSVLELVSDEGAHTEKLNGKNYKVYIIRKVILTPLQEGKINLDGANVESEVGFTRAGNPYQVQKNTATFSNSSEAINILALPSKNKPGAFNGMVGSFSVNASLKTKGVAVGENNSLLISINGYGNTQSVELPLVDWPDHIEHFDATKKEDVNKMQFPLSGSISFEIPFISTKEGSQTIPPINIAYFDPVTGIYKNSKTDSIHLNFTKTIISHSVPPEVIVHEDISNKKYLWIVAGIAVAASILLLITLGKKTVTEKNKVTPDGLPGVGLKTTEQEKTDNITKEKTDFRTSLSMLSQMDEPQLFYSSAKKLLTQALKESLESEAPLNELILLLKLKTSTDQLSAKCTAIINKCELALYAGMTDLQERITLLSNLEEVIQELNS